MKFKGKAKQEGMVTKNEHVISDGKFIAMFVNGELETSDPGLIERLKSLGYETIEAPKEPPKEVPKEGKKK